MGLSRARPAGTRADVRGTAGGFAWPLLSVFQVRDDGRVAVTITEREPMRFHHLGMAVHSIEKSAPGIARSMGLGVESDLLHDPVQKVRALFLRPWSQGLRVELIEPTTEDSPIMRFLDRTGGGLHHVCYEVDDLDRSLSDARSRGGRVVCPPVQAVGFRGRRIAFCYTREKILLEFAEAPVTFAEGIPYAFDGAARTTPAHAKGPRG